MRSFAEGSLGTRRGREDQGRRAWGWGVEWNDRESEAKDGAAAKGAAAEGAASMVVRLKVIKSDARGMGKVGVI